MKNRKQPPEKAFRENAKRGLLSRYSIEELRERARMVYWLYCYSHYPAAKALTNLLEEAIGEEGARKT